MLNFGQYIGWNKNLNQESKPAIPIMTQEEIKTALKHTYEVKPAAYKNINSSSMNLNNNLKN